MERSTRNNSTNNEEICDRCTGVRTSGFCTCVRNGTCACQPNAAPSPSCVYYSPRIQDLLEGQRTEFETARDHWTEVDPTSEAEAKSLAEDNRKYFDEVLKTHPEWGDFFKRFEDLEVGEKIGEGGQAEIFAAVSPSFRVYESSVSLVAKVWKEGISLKNLAQQWPPQMLSKVAKDVSANNHPFNNIYGGAFIRDGEFQNRFAFVMQKYWGDLRDSIDKRMLQLLRNKCHGPPFDKFQSVYVLMYISAASLSQMHAVGVLHRNIKASNVLVRAFDDHFQYPTVIDYECSVGVIGTGFWRAHEILEQVRKGIPCQELAFTDKSDVYCFGMMCSEIVTGRIPFERHPLSNYNIVLSGQRPELPHDLNPWIKELIMDCSQHDPKLRPTSYEIFNRIRSHKNNKGGNVYELLTYLLRPLGSKDRI